MRVCRPCSSSEVDPGWPRRGGASGSGRGSASVAPPVGNRLRCGPAPPRPRRSGPGFPASAAIPAARGAHSSITTGSAVIHQHDAPAAGMRRHDEIAQQRRDTKPNEKKPASAPVKLPRKRRATNSARWGAMMALSAPVPMPAITRAAKNGGQLSTQALTSEATQYSASAHIITARRPIRSPSVPASSAPKENPMKVLLPSSRSARWSGPIPPAARAG